MNDSEIITGTVQTDDGTEKKSRLKKVIASCPVLCRVFFVLDIISGIMLLLFSLIPSFSDFYNRYPGAFVRMILAKATGWFPFSLAECMIMLMPAALVLFIVVTVRTYKKTVYDLLRLLFILLSILSWFFISFVFGFAAGYRGSTLYSAAKLDLDKKNVSAAELRDTALIIRDELDALTDKIVFSGSGSSVTELSFSEINECLNGAYAEAAEKYDFLPSFTSKVKQIVLSEPMTYTHIAGVYSYFTGESNVNVNFPDYDTPYTAAHEMAHQRGVAPEDEANFVAFLVCSMCDEPYVRYSGYMNLFEYVLNALYKADKNMYNEVISSTDKRLTGEMRAYNAFFAKYENNVAAKVSSKVNDTYLKSQGQQSGEKSYGLVVDLAVAYYKSESNND